MIVAPNGLSVGLTPSTRIILAIVAKIAIAIASIYLLLFGLLTYEVTVARSVYARPDIGIKGDGVKDLIESRCPEFPPAHDLMMPKNCLLSQLEGAKSLIPIALAINFAATLGDGRFKEDLDVQTAVNNAVEKAHAIIDQNAKVISDANKATEIIRVLNPLFPWVSPYLSDLPLNTVLKEAEDRFFLPKIVRARQKATELTLAMVKH